MKNNATKLFIEIFFFLLFMGAILLLLEYKFSNYNTPVDYVFSDLKNEKQRNKIDFVYIGSSHMGIIGEYHPNEDYTVRNYAFQGLDLFKQYTILKRWLPKMKNLKGVLLCLDYELIGHNQTISGEPHLDRQFYKYTDTLYAYNFTNKIMSSLNFFRSNRDLSYLFKNETKITVKKERDFSEFIPVESRNNLSEVNCMKRARELSQIKFRKSVVEENLQILIAIFDLCERYNIEIVFFNPPKRACYKNSINVENVSLAKDKIQQLLTEHNIIFYDFYDDKDFEDSDLVDYDHLNTKGAEKLINKILK